VNRAPRVRAGLALAGLLSLTACGAPPPVNHPEMPVDLPETWTARASADSASADSASASLAAAAPVAWWGSFEDDRLEELVTEALEHNWDLAAASARVDAAAAQARIAGAEIFPQLGASGRAGRAQQVFIGLPVPGAPDGEPLKTTTSSFGVSLDISWELDIWGRLRNQRSAAGADFQAAAADLHGARLSLASQTLKGWFNALATRRQMELADSTAQSFQVTVDGVRERYQQGVRSSLDLRLAMVDQANAERALAVYRLAYERSVRQLEILLGRYPEGALAIDGNLAPPPAPVPAGLPSELIARRPDIAAPSAADLPHQLRRALHGGARGPGLRRLQRVEPRRQHLPADLPGRPAPRAGARLAVARGGSARAVRECGAARVR